jgi:hypothetical protein
VVLQLGIGLVANNLFAIKDKFIMKNAIEPQTWPDSLDK